jgi:Zn-dependent peptidase ImmA (M78 family)
VLLNGGDAPAGKSFSALHEVCHLLLRDGGLCLPGEERPGPGENDEVLCNRIAGAALLPAGDLLAHDLVRGTAGREEWTDEAVAKLARDYAVSREAVLRRLLILGRTTERFYRLKRQQYHQEWQTQQGREADFAVPPHTRALNRLGRLFARSVLESFYDGRLSAADLPRYLGLKLKHLADFEAAVYRS